MSYCRWSSDDFACDIYAYEADNGFTIHIAGNRILGDVPKMLPIDHEDWLSAYRAQHEFLATAQRETITLPHAGETFVCDDLEDFKARLLMLREIGYNFPDYVLDEIDAEMKDEASQ